MSHSLIAVGAVGLESHCILGTADERRSPSLSFRCLILPNSKKVPFSAGLTERVFQSPHGAAEPRTHAIRRLLHHSRAALTTRPRRLSKFSNRLKSQAEEIIAEEQAGSEPEGAPQNRSLTLESCVKSTSNIRRIYNLSSMISKKAFDRVWHSAYGPPCEVHYQCKSSHTTE